jgi:hypothetical protein
MGDSISLKTQHWFNYSELLIFSFLLRWVKQEFAGELQNIIFLGAERQKNKKRTKK